MLVKFLYTLIIYLLFQFGNNVEQFTNKINLDGIIYINLDKRPDRKESISKELNNIFSDYSIPIERLSATYIPKNGHKGCAHSHYRALKKAQENRWTNVLIFEDDFHFSFPKEEVQSRLEKLFNNLDVISNWKCVLFTGNGGQSVKTQYQGLNKIINGYLTTSCYLVNSTYYQNLIDLFYQSYMSMSSDHTSEKNYETKAIDQQWRKPQENEDGWFILDPFLGKQNDQLISSIQSETNYNNSS